MVVVLLPLLTPPWPEAWTVKRELDMTLMVCESENGQAMMNKEMEVGLKGWERSLECLD